MAWEDDELTAWNENVKKKQQSDELTLRRHELLKMNASTVWMNLRQVFSEKCLAVSRKAGRDVLKSTDHHANELKIQREDGAIFQGSYSPDRRTISFSSNSCEPCTRNYTIDIYTENSKDFVAIIDQMTKRQASNEDIASLLLSNFLRSPIK